jgi:hypothetical protein
MEVLVACLILTSAVAAGMYLFRTGFDHLDRANTSNVISSKLPQAITLIRASDLGKKSAIEDMGDEATLEWAATVLDSVKPGGAGAQNVWAGTPNVYEMFLYKVHMKLTYKKKSREYDLNVFRYRRAGSPEAFAAQ